jgi:RimJ/RimL family protein N-acetyltransferase
VGRTARLSPNVHYNLSMGYGWEGKLVRLAPIDVEKHLDNAQRWINDPEVTENILGGDFPMSRLAEREWIETQSKRNDKEITFALELLSGEHIGFSSLMSINWQHRTAITGTMMAKEYWGKGYGSDAARVRTRYAFEVLGLRYLMSAVLDGNTRSLGMLKKSGYVECGHYPERFWKRGKFVGEVVLYMTSEMWENSRATD